MRGDALQTFKSPNQQATIAKNQVTIKISAVNSNEKRPNSKQYE